MEITIPQLLVEDIRKNENNPFKKTIYWRQIRCRLCNEIVLGKGISNQKEWKKIKKHLKIRHDIEVDEDIPVRLLSPPLFRRWFKKQIKIGR